MAYALGKESITGTLLADQLGSVNQPVQNAYITNIIPSPIVAADNLQDVLTAGNVATEDILLDGTEYKLGSALDTRGSLSKSDVGVGANVVFKVKPNSAALLQEALQIREDKALVFDDSIIIKSTNGDEVQIGKDTNNVAVGDESVNVGENAGTNGHAGVRAVNIGYNSGNTNCGSRSVAIGDEAGEFNSGFAAVSIGVKAGESGTGAGAVCIGNNAGKTLTRDNCVVIGDRAAPTCGVQSIAVGYLAGSAVMGDNCIVLNASGSALNTGGNNRCYVDPIRPETTNDDLTLLSRNGLSKEVSVDRLRWSVGTVPASAGNTYNVNPNRETLLVTRWTGGTGTFNIRLPNATDVAVGYRIIIKNNTQVPGQLVTISPQGLGVDTIDGSNTGVVLDGSNRTTTGGGGSCIELCAVSGASWVVVCTYNQAVGY